LLGQARHLAAVKAEEVRVIAWAPGVIDTMGAEAPDPVHALNAVCQAGFLEGSEGSVERHAIETIHLGLNRNLLVRQWSHCLEEEI